MSGKLAPRMPGNSREHAGPATGFERPPSIKALPGQDVLLDASSGRPAMMKSTGSVGPPRGTLASVHADHPLDLKHGVWRGHRIEDTR